MSLGFLTESALLPSKAKAIHVDSKSLVDLRAVVFQKEQERDERKRKSLAAARDDDHDGDIRSGGTTSRGAGRYAHLRATRQRTGAESSGLSRTEEKIGKSTKSNRGVEKRQRRDAAARELELGERDDDRAWHRKSREMLEKKAKLYDDMVHGRGDAVAAEYLVDFSAKQQNGADVSAANDAVEITDEFGRSRVVLTTSAEYAAYLKLQRLQAVASKEKERGLPVTPFERLVGTEDTAGGHNGSFVVSQWEKRLNAQEKTYVQEVHERATQAKTAVLDKKTRKQLRLERLWRETGMSTSPATTTATADPRKLTAEDEQVASAKATAFLNQLGSLV